MLCRVDRHICTPTTAILDAFVQGQQCLIVVFIKVAVREQHRRRQPRARLRAMQVMQAKMNTPHYLNHPENRSAAEGCGKAGSN